MGCKVEWVFTRMGREHFIFLMANIYICCVHMFPSRHVNLTLISSADWLLLAVFPAQLLLGVFNKSLQELFRCFVKTDYCL